MAKIKSKKKAAAYVIPADPSGPCSAIENQVKRKPTKKTEFKKTADKTQDEWLEKKSENPYVKFKRNLLKKVDPSHHSIWIKYIRKVDGKRCSGGMIVQNHTPEYIKLKNPYSHIQFSVQLKDITVFTRKSSMKDMKKLR